MWKDDVIDRYATAIAQLIDDGAPRERWALEFTGIVLDGTCRVSAVVIGVDRVALAPTNFFDVADLLEAELLAWHREFAAHGESWKAVRLVVGADDDVEVQFEYDHPYRWDT